MPAKGSASGLLSRFQVIHLMPGRVDKMGTSAGVSESEIPGFFPRQSLIPARAGARAVFEI
jgi:hypothetical protein